MPKLNKKELRRRRHDRLRKKVEGTAARPRMSVFVSNKHLYVQMINDEMGVTIAATSTLSPDFVSTGAKFDVKGAEALGKIIAEKSISAGVKEAVFDRGGFAFHGKIKALADSARKNGLKI